MNFFFYAKDWPRDNILENVNEEEKVNCSKVQNLFNSTESFINIRNITDFEKSSSFHKLVMFAKYGYNVLLFFNKSKKSLPEPSLFKCNILFDVKNLLLKDVQNNIKFHKNYNQWEVSLTLFTDVNGIVYSKSGWFIQCQFNRC